MRGTRAKIIRRVAYGPDGSPRQRDYRAGRNSSRRFWDRVTDTFKFFTITGTITAGPLRKTYRELKRAWTRGA